MTWQAPTETWICPTCGTMWTVDATSREPVAGPFRWIAGDCCREEYVVRPMDDGGIGQGV